MTVTKLHQKHKGILLIISAAFCFACMSACIRMAGSVPTIQKSLFRNIVALTVAAITLLREGKGFRPANPKNWPFLLGRAFFGTIGILANFYAIDHLLLPDATMLNKMAPFFAVIASIFLLREKISGMQVVSLVGAFSGALLVIKPTFTNMDFGPSLVGLAGGIVAGVAYTFVRMLGQRGERGSFIVFFFSLFSCLVVLPFILLDYTPMTVQQTLWLLGAGLCATGGQFSITGAYRCAPAREISVYDYSQILWAAILGFAFFGDVPDFLSVLGYIIICSMALMNFLHNNKRLHHA